MYTDERGERPNGLTTRTAERLFIRAVLWDVGIFAGVATKVDENERTSNVNRLQVVRKT